VAGGRGKQKETKGEKMVKQTFAKNQYIIETPMGVLFQSYRSAIALRDKGGKIHLSEHWNYSKTTGKYRNQFLGETKAETEKKIRCGEYLLDLSLGGEIKYGFWDIIESELNH